MYMRYLGGGVGHRESGVDIETSKQHAHRWTQPRQPEPAADQDLSDDGSAADRDDSPPPDDDHEDDSPARTRDDYADGHDLDRAHDSDDRAPHDRPQGARTRNGTNTSHHGVARGGRSGPPYSQRETRATTSRHQEQLEPLEEFEDEAEEYDDDESLDEDADGEDSIDGDVGEENEYAIGDDDEYEADACEDEYTADAGEDEYEADALGDGETWDEDEEDYYDEVFAAEGFAPL